MKLFLDIIATVILWAEMAFYFILIVVFFIILSPYFLTTWAYERLKKKAGVTRP